MTDLNYKLIEIFLKKPVDQRLSLTFCDLTKYLIKKALQKFLPFLANSSCSSKKSSLDSNQSLMQNVKTLQKLRQKLFFSLQKLVQRCFDFFLSYTFSCERECRSVIFVSTNIAIKLEKSTFNRSNDIKNDRSDTYLNI